MNVNIKLSLTDEQRNTLYRNMTGKDVKRMVSRAEVNELVNDYINDMMNDRTDIAVKRAERVIEAQPEPELLLEHLPCESFAGGHDQCCRQNALLMNRMNRLQFQLDKCNR